MGKKLIALLIAAILLMQFSYAQDKTAPKITIGKITVSSTEARIEWATNEQSTSVITVLDQVKKLERMKSFSTTIQNLEPGKEYQYDITACDAAINCGHYQGKFTTASKGTSLQAEKKQGITGAVISADLINEAKSIATMVFFGLLAIVILGVVVKTGYNAFTNISDPAEKQIKEAVRNAESLIKQGKNDDAMAHYNSARSLYSQIPPDKQAKYYDRLILAYNQLQQHQKAKEAGRLADRYIAGSITKDELEKLKDLLV
jgi:hypothetical protein